MPLKKSAGNMYDWVTHTHSHLGGECPHLCKYCYVQRNRFGVSPRYQGPARLIENEFLVDYGKGKTIFIEHMNDLFADGILDGYIESVLQHCVKYPHNDYVFQTKNPNRAYDWVTAMPARCIMVGTTIESNRHYPEISKAPYPCLRAIGLAKFKGQVKTFITIEPILDFDIDPMVKLIVDSGPEFINIGADSKHCGLPEPSHEKVKEFIAKLQEAKITIRKKVNLERMLI